METDLNEQSSNAKIPSHSTESGIITDSVMAIRNAPLPIVSTDFPIDTDSSDLQYSNALSPIIVTEFPIVADLSDEHLENATTYRMN